MAAAATDAGEWSAAARLRLVWRVVRAAELLGLAVLLSRSFPRLPYAASAASSALRLAASLLLHPRSIFVIANAIVLLLYVFSRRDPSSSSSASDQDAQDQFLSFTATPLLSPSTTEAPALAVETDAVFEDKQAVHVTVRAPRRSRSEKIGAGKLGGRRAGSPDMRWSDSDNGRRRRSTSSAAPEECGAEDEKEEFRKAVEAFIAKQQTRFHREESFVLVDGAGVGDDAQAITVAVK
ncbi:hypothetical protein CFC21_047405 [Triticum aestivum]|uniref:DUF4408 domain-containing protein n=2 Tax=Triticum aestivum TaxID=4565 RepID=A0A9R1FXY6_WHEAT|nr:uncharacterized protein LOC123074558 [Triticum aestivum]KAF7036883.1 hypothetical protein CFC21_047405 [Triticum aestivum]